MNRGQLRAALARRLGIPESGDGLLDDVSMNDILNAALRDMTMEHDWPWLVWGWDLTFIASDAAVPDDYVKARELVITTNGSATGRRARYVGLAEFLDARASGLGCVWTTPGPFVTVSPTPTVAFTEAMLWYFRTEPSLDDDTTEPVLPALYHDVLLARAAYRANVRRNREDQSIRDDNEYQLGVRKMRDATRQKVGPSTVRAAGTQYPWAVWS